MPLFNFKLHDRTDGDTEYCIGSVGLNAEYVQMCLASAGDQESEFEISSVGGDLKAGIDMYDAIRANGKADTRIGAMAASSAGIVAMGGRKVRMSKYGLLMLHKPMTGSGGNADDLARDMDMLNIMQGRIAQIYADKSGLDIDTINSLINGVTWLTADQALDLGFIDEIIDYQAEVENHKIVSVYAQSAPAVYQRVFNKLQIETTMTKEEKEALEKKNGGVLAAIYNWFNKSKVKTVTDKGTIVTMQALNVGVAVSNEDGEDMPDDTYTAKNSEGKEVKMKVKNGVIDEMETEKDEETDTEEDVQNGIVLNSVGIKVINKTEAASVAKVITNHVATIADLNKKLLEVTNQLAISNTAVQKTEEALRAEIKSEFTPNGSKRSDKGVTNNMQNMPDAFKPKSDVANNYVKRAVASAK